MWATHAAGAETGEAQAKAVTMFTDMMAEMGAYGEAFIAADQIPVKLAPEVLKNTNVKIIQRLAATDDRTAVAASMNLSEAESRFLSVLPPGIAVVHDDTIGSAVLTRVPGADNCVNAGLEPFFQALSLAEQEPSRIGWNPPSRTGAPSG